MIHYIFTKVSTHFNYFEKRTIVSYVNVYNYLELRKSSNLIKSIDKFTLDGILLIWCFRILFNKKFKRLSCDFSSYGTTLFRLCNQNKKKVYFIGGSQEEIDKFVAIIQSKFPNIEIVGFRSGFFKKDESSTIIDDIKTLTTDLVFVGMGTPKQEEFAVRLKENDFQGTIYTCGAFISQTSNHGFHYYPDIVNTFHLRWLYRLLKEKGLFKRYFVQYPYALLLILKDYTKGK